jgi:hypothetical protein
MCEWFNLRLLFGVSPPGVNVRLSLLFGRYSGLIMVLVLILILVFVVILVVVRAQRTTYVEL